MKALLFLLLLIHGLIHGMGFVKGFGLAELTALSQPIPRPMGLLWLLAALLFLAAGVSLLMNAPAWWMFALAGILLSQIVIAASWSDARWGTLANLILILPVLAAYGQWQFDRQVDQEVRAFETMAVAPVQPTPLDSLPPVVRRWLVQSGFSLKLPRQVSITQHGRMRLKPEGRWMPFSASQTFHPDHPGFIWRTQVDMMPGISFLGRDAFLQGHGHMLIKILGWIPVADASGPTTDQGTMLRYLGETVWFPAGALHPAIAWEQIDDTRARATITRDGQSASGLFTFTPEGRFVRFAAKRYYDRNGSSTLEDWLITVRPDGYRTINGYTIPASLDVTWQLTDGDFTWMNLEIDSLKVVD